MNLKAYIRKLLYNYRLGKQRKWAVSVEKQNLDVLILQKLSKQETREVFKQWGSLGLKINPLFYRMFKTVEGFDPKYLSDDLFYPLIIRSLNPLNYSLSFEHKGFYSFLFNEIKQPKNYVKKIRGVFYDSDMNVIKESDAVDYLRESVKSFIIKPTKNSCMGRNIRKIDVGNDCDLVGIFREYGNDFVIQQVLKQSSQTSVYNKSSLNTFRVSSLYLNGVISICSIVLRCGQGEVFIDNCGAGGLLVGVDEKGYLREYAYDNKYHRHKQTEEGIEFRGKYIQGVAKIIGMVKKYHPKYFPNLGFIGWDICLNSEDEPVLIEVNLRISRYTNRAVRCWKTNIWQIELMSYRLCK